MAGSFPPASGTSFATALQAGCYQRSQANAYTLGPGSNPAADVKWTAPKAGYVLSMGGYVQAASGTYTVTLYKNGVATAMAQAVVCDNTAKNFLLNDQALAFAANDILSVAGNGGATAFSVTCFVAVCVYAI